MCAIICNVNFPVKNTIALLSQKMFSALELFWV